VCCGNFVLLYQCAKGKSTMPSVPFIYSLDSEVRAILTRGFESMEEYDKSRKPVLRRTQSGKCSD
jgi:hypothetical protein